LAALSRSAIGGAHAAPSTSASPWSHPSRPLCGLNKTPGARACPPAEGSSRRLNIIFDLKMELIEFQAIFDLTKISEVVKHSMNMLFTVWNDRKINSLGVFEL
jgi:hypothetical protein